MRKLLSIILASLFIPTSIWAISVGWERLVTGSIHPFYSDKVLIGATSTTTTNTLEVIGSGYFSTNLAVIGTSTISGNLTVSGTSTLSSNLNLAGTFNASGTSEFTGTSTFKNANFLGNVGIATTSPATTLQVYGTSTFMGGNVGIGTTGPSNKLTVDLGVANNSQGILAISSGGEAALDLRNTATGGKEWQILSTGGAAGSGQGKFGLYNLTDAVYPFVISNTGNVWLGGTTAYTSPAMTIQATGNVGIGTTSPAYTLSVNGTTTIENGGLILGKWKNGFLKVNASGVVSTSTIDISAETNLAAGNYLTLSEDTINLDTEIASNTLSINLLNATNTKEAMFKKQNTYTITKISCNSVNGTTTFNLLERTEAAPNTGGTAVLTSSLVCGVSGTASSSAFSNAGIAANVPVAASTTAVNGTNVDTYIYVNYFFDD